MSGNVLMPKATARWLVDNTALTWEQIGDFCGLHWLEVKSIADGEVARDIRGFDPIAAGQLTRDEIDKASKNEDYRLKLKEPMKLNLPERKRKTTRFIPISRRQDRPDAIMWILRNHPEITDIQISKLVGTTKNTIESVRTRTHWNIANIKPVDPVTIGLCSQIELDATVKRAADAKAREIAKAAKLAEGPGLKPLGEGGVAAQ